MGQFEHDSGRGAIANFGFRQSDEQIAAEREANEERAERARVLLAEERARREAAESAATRAYQRQSEENLKAEVVEVLLKECPFLSETDAKLLYSSEIKKLVAVERFKAAYFGKPSEGKRLFPEIKM